jgi:F0F1-type ATP synthase assembly protein I
MSLPESQPEIPAYEPRWYRSRAQSITGSTHQRVVPSMDNTAWIISSRLIAGLVLYAGLGWVASLWLGNRAALMAVGALVGLGLSYYLIFTGLARENKAMRENGSAGNAWAQKTGSTLLGTTNTDNTDSTVKTEGVR